MMNYRNIENSPVSLQSEKSYPTENGTGKRGGYMSINFGEDGGDKIKDLRSFLVIGFIVFIGDTARGLMFPTLWPLVSSMGGTEMTQGFTVAAFSFGRVLSSPRLGRMSTNLGYRKVLVLSLTIIMLGCLLYAKAWNCYILMVAQMIIGIGSGTLGVTRAYVADNSTRHNRTVLMAKLTALQYAGFTVTPCVGGLLSYMIRDNNYQLVLGFKLSQFTAPAFTMLLLAMVGIAFLVTLFSDYVPKQALKPVESRPVIPSESVDDNLRNYGDGTMPPTPVPADKKDADGGPDTPGRERIHSGDLAECPESLWKSMVAWGLIMNIVTKGSVSCYETLGTIVAIGVFGLPKSSAGFLFAFCGFMGVFALLSMHQLTKMFEDLKLVFYGCILMVVPSLLLFMDDKIGIYGLISAVFLMYAIGYPIGHTAVIGIFSKIVGAKTNKQGSLLGWFGSAGSLARIIFPITCGIVSSQFGSHTMFLFVGIFVGISVLVLLCLWKSINMLIQ